jgi:hypothetical protein
MSARPSSLHTSSTPCRYQYCLLQQFEYIEDLVLNKEQERLCVSLQVTREDCDLIQEAMKRYYRVIVETLDSGMQTSGRVADKRWKKDPRFKAYLDSLEIQLMAPCEVLPHLHMDEHCKYDSIA